MKERSLFLILFGTMVMVLAPLSPAQVTTGTIYGRVLDSTGAVVPRANVTAIHEQTGVAKPTTADEQGEFTLTFLPVGKYTISIEMSGFSTYRETGLELASGQKVRRDFALRVGQIQETVTVTSEQELLNASSAQKDLIHTNLELSELPLVRRDFADIVSVGTGVARSGDGVSINGLPEAGFTFTVDGTDASGNMELQAVASYQSYNFVKGVSIDAIDEVRISKNIFSAEIANAMGGNVNIITKSGTNTFHGSAFENYQAGGLNARNQFVATKQPLIFHQFGGSLGGPISKNRMFFFGTYEGYRLTAKQSVNGVVPTRDFRETATKAVPAYKQFFDMYPLPTEQAQPGDVTAFFQGVGAERARENHALARWDYNLTSRDILSVRYTRARPLRLTPGISEASPRSWTGKTERIGASYTRVSPRWSSETRFGYNQSNTERGDGIFKLGIPAMNALGLGLAGEIFIISGDTTSIEEVIALTHGRHSVKTGGIFLYWRSRRENQEVPVFDII